MNTELLKINEENGAKVFAKCRDLFLAGELVAFPTETVYGLGGNGLNPESSKKIYAAKGRPSDNPLILHVGDRSQIPPLVKSIPEKAEKLMDAFFPGPLTIIMDKADIVPKETSGGLDTVAIRMPSHPTANEMLRAAGVPIAAPSANLSGRPSTTSAEHVMEDLSGRIAAVIDDGEATIGVESTIIDCTAEKPVLLRPGYITKEELEAVVGPIDVDPAITAEAIIHHTNAVEHPKAPGMKYRHYAPKAELTIVTVGESESNVCDPGLDPNTRRVVEYILAHADENTGILTVEEHKNLFPVGKVLSVGTLQDPDTISHNLFRVLRQFDELDVNKIYSEDFTELKRSQAIMNRLLKAAGGQEVIC